MSTILNESGEGRPRHGRVLTYFFIFLTISVCELVQGGGLDCNLWNKRQHIFLRF